VNGAVRARYRDADETLVSLEINGAPVADDALYTVGLQGYHVANSVAYLDVSADELAEAGPSKVVSTSGKQVLDEWLRGHQNVGRTVEGRLTYE
jgi:5'-nucleotidase